MTAQKGAVLTDFDSRSRGAWTKYPETPERSILKKWLLPLSILVLACALLLTVILLLKKETASSERLTQSFSTYITGVKGMKRLQLVEVNAIESIERTSEFRLFWDVLRFPDVVVEARVPVRYLYYVDFDEALSIETEEERIQVFAPPLRAGMPAADVSGIQYQVTKGSLFRNSSVAVEELRKSITPWLNQSAEQNRELVRAEARRELEGFVRSWLSASGLSTDQEIQIHFADDPEAARP